MKMRMKTRMFVLSVVLLPNRRYAHVLQRLVIEEAPPQKVAEEMGTTIDNLYNIKKRALTQLTQLLTQAGIKKR